MSMSSSARPLQTRPTPLASAIGQQSGFGLLEVLLTLGAASVMSLAVYGLFFSSSVTAEVKKEQANLNTLSTAINRSFGLTGGFNGVSINEVMAEGLLPSSYQRSGAVRTEWGTAVDVRANRVVNPNDSFIIEYANVPADACIRLASAMAPNVYDLRVGGVSVFAAESLNPAAAANACRAGAKMEFVYFSGLASGSAVATPSLTLPPAPPSVTPPNPSTPTGPVTGAPSVDDATPGTPGVVSPGTPSAPPPAAPAAPPAPATPQTPQPTPTVLPPSTPPGLKTCTVPPTQTQNLNCPAGQIGTVTQQRVGYCGEVGGPYEAWATGTYGPWTTVSSTCAPACVAPSPTSVAITRTAPAESQNVGCPAGQTGNIVQQRTRVENGTRTTSWTCPAATGSPVSSTSESWSGTFTPSSGWVTTSNTCTTPTPPAKTYPSYSGKSWISWGDGGLYGWGVFCSVSQFYADQSHCTQSVNTNDDATFSPTLPPEQALTPARRSCVAALQQRLTPMPGFGYTPSNGPVTWPSECACDVVGAGSAFYWQVTGASDWSAYEFKCP